jgi:hypothetical protein
MPLRLVVTVNGDAPTAFDTACKTFSVYRRS